MTPVLLRLWTTFPIMTHDKKPPNFQTALPVLSSEACSCKSLLPVFVREPVSPPLLASSHEGIDWVVTGEDGEKIASLPLTPSAWREDVARDSPLVEDGEEMVWLVATVLSGRVFDPIKELPSKPLVTVQGRLL